MEEETGSELSELARSLEAAVAAGGPPGFDVGSGELVMSPRGQGPGHWVGAPSVAVDTANGRVLLSYRCRAPRDGSPDERGYLAAIAESTDGGRTFTDIWSLSKHEVGTSSLERFCLRAGASGWLLYTSWEAPPSSGQWRVDVMAAARPEEFSLADARPVLLPGPLGVDAVKDPYVVDRGHGAPIAMFVSTFLTPKGPAPTTIATSSDGFNFDWQGQALAVGEGWDAYQARLTSVVPFGPGYAGYYDGAASAADDTEEHCGLAVSNDLTNWVSASTQGPVLTSAYATGSLRYVDVVAIEGKWWAYFERARPDGAHELARQRLSSPPWPAAPGLLDL